jgi:hypothetical protein
MKVIHSEMPIDCVEQGYEEMWVTISLRGEGSFAPPSLALKGVGGLVFYY